MKLTEYIKQLQDFVKEDPKNGDLLVINAIDDEGNGYNEVHYGPSVGIFEDSEFYSHEEDFEEYGYTKDDINAVCIN